MEKSELIKIHELYDEIASWLRIDYEGTEYREFGVGKNAVHRQNDSHFKALSHLSDLVAEELGVQKINFDKSISDNELLEESGDVELYDTGQYLLRVGSSEMEIGRNSTSKLDTLRYLAEGLSLEKALDQNYSKNSNFYRERFDFLQGILEDDRVPEEYREDLDAVLKEIT